MAVHPVGLPYQNLTLVGSSSSSSPSTQSNTVATSVGVAPTSPGASSSWGSFAGIGVAHSNTLGQSTTFDNTVSLTEASKSQATNIESAPGSHNGLFVPSAGFNSDSAPLYPTRAPDTESTGHISAPVSGRIYTTASSHSGGTSIVSANTNSSSVVRSGNIGNTSGVHTTSTSNSAMAQVPSAASVGTYSPAASGTLSRSMRSESDRLLPARVSVNATSTGMLASAQNNHPVSASSSSVSNGVNFSVVFNASAPYDMQVGNTGRPWVGKSNETHASTSPRKSQGTYTTWSGHAYRTGAITSSIPTGHSKQNSSGMAHASGGSWSKTNETQVMDHNVTSTLVASAGNSNLNTTSISPVHSILTNSSFGFVGVNLSAPSLINRPNSTLLDSIPTNLTISQSTPKTSNTTNWTVTGYKKLSMSKQISAEDIEKKLRKQLLPLWNSSNLNDTNILYLNESRQPHFAIGSASKSKYLPPWFNQTASVLNQTDQCLGIETEFLGLETVTYTAITEIYEMVTLGSNCTTPTPVYVLPPSACSTVTMTAKLPEINEQAGGDGITEEVLYVTKKVPVVVRSPPPVVGPVNNTPTAKPEPKPVQSSSSSNPAEDLSAQKMQALEQSAGSAPLHQENAVDSPSIPNPPAAGLPDADSRSDTARLASDIAASSLESTRSSSNANQGGSAEGSGSNAMNPGFGPNPANPGVSAPGSGSHSAGSDSGSNVAGSNSNPANSRVIAPGPGSNTAASISDSVSSDTNAAGSGSGAIGSGSMGAKPETYVPGAEANAADRDGKSSGNNVHPPGVGQAPGIDRQIMNGGQSSGTSAQTANGDQTANSNGQPIKAGQASGPDGQAAPQWNDDQKTDGQGQAPGGLTVPGNEVQTVSAGGQPASGSSQQTPDRPGSISSGVGNLGHDSQNVGPETHSSTEGNGQSNAGKPIAADGVSNNPNRDSEDNAAGASSEPVQYVPAAVNINNVPISIDRTAVIVGSETVNAGSPPTTIVADGQTIKVDQSQIVASGTTIPIETAVASQPASSTTLGNVPVVLRPHDVAIGSQTFSHGSSAAFAVYDGQTYSWDAKQLVGPDGSMASFPSATVAPRITAGGQVFSVLSSTLKAPGTDIAIPNASSASSFVYQNQSFSINPSQLVVPETSITVPPATMQQTPFVYNGETFSVDSSNLIAPSATLPLSSGSGTLRYGTEVLTIDKSQVAFPSTTIMLSSMAQAGSLATPSLVTSEGVAFSLGPAAAVVASSTYSFLPGQAPATITDQGKAITLSPNGVQIGNVHVPVPTPSPNYSVVSQGNLTFSVAPSAVVFNGQTNDVQPGVAPMTTNVNGQEISIGSEGVGIGGTKVPLPMTTNPSGFAVVTQDGITVSLAPSAVVLNGQTNSIQPGMTPVLTEVNGQTVSIGPEGVQVASTTIPLPKAANTAGYEVVTQGGLTFSLAPSAVVYDGQTHSIQPGMAPFTSTLQGQVVNIGPQGLEIASTTIPLPTPPPVYAVVSRGDLTFSVAPSEAVIRGSTFSIGPNATATLILDGQTVGVGPNQIQFPGSTVNLPSITSKNTPAAVTADGLTFSVGPTEAVIGGTSYAIGSGAVAKTVMFGSKTIALGADGVILPSTTVPPAQGPIAITAGDLSFLADATEAIINGTAYAIGSDAIAKTIVYGSETIGLGTKGIVLSSTTIVPWGNATQNSHLSVLSASTAAAASSSAASISAAALEANMSPSGLPGALSGGRKHSSTGPRLGTSRFVYVIATMSGLMLGLLLCL